MGFDNALKRLKGESPAGPPSESGCGDAERRNDQRPTDIPRGSAVVEAKGRVEFERVLKECRAEAAELKSSAAMYPDTDWGNMKRLTEKAEAVGILFAVAKLAALCAEPRPQSGEEEMEECPACRVRKTWNTGGLTRTCTRCGNQWARGKRMERSGLRNAESSHARNER